MKTVKGQPITAGRTEYSKKRPYVPDAKDTSLDEQNLIKEAPAPFKNRMTAAQLPAGSKAPGGVSTMEPKILSGLKRTTPGARALPPRGPVGQRKPINQSGQVFGRMGTSHPRRQGAFPSGYKAKRNASFYGES